MVKYNADWEITNTNTNENLQIVKPQFFPDKLIYIYIYFKFGIILIYIGLSGFRFD